MKKILKLLLNFSAIFTFFFALSANASEIDEDNDGLIDRFENMIGTDLNNIDSDNDSLSDALEVFNGYDPLSLKKQKLKISYYELDSDNDGLSDYIEANIASNHKQADSDNDGFSDGDEIQSGYSPLDSSPIWREKRIEISIDKQRLSYFVGPHHINSIPVSTGLPGLETPKGEYKVLKKLDVHVYRGKDYEFKNTKWNLLFKLHSLGNYYIHGAYWHNNFGRKMSHGCVNVSYKNIEPIYNWADLETQIIIR